MPVKCSDCGSENIDGAKTCTMCGIVIRPPEPPKAPARPGAPAGGVRPGAAVAPARPGAPVTPARPGAPAAHPAATPAARLGAAPSTSRKAATPAPSEPNRLPLILIGAGVLVALVVGGIFGWPYLLQLSMQKVVNPATGASIYIPKDWEVKVNQDPKPNKGLMISAFYYRGNKDDADTPMHIEVGAFAITDMPPEAQKLTIDDILKIKLDKLDKSNLIGTGELKAYNQRYVWSFVKREKSNGKSACRKWYLSQQGGYLYSFECGGETDIIAKKHINFDKMISTFRSIK